MKKYICIITFLFTLQFVAYSQNVSKKTYLYSIKDLDTLYLDKYTYVKPKKDSVILSKPAVIFMFGGGFYTGQRDNPLYIPFFEYLSANGYEVFSIDYRLGLKKFQNDDNFMNHISGKKTKKLKGVEFVKIFDKTVKMAVEDLYIATAYIIKHSKEWNIDTSNIIAAGSSAGAISVLQAEYFLSNNYTELTKILPNNFNYAGIISFAGAILNYHSKLKWNNSPCPLALFHGDIDKVVPYNRIWTPIGSFNGSKRIVQSLIKEKSPYLFSTYHNCDHKIAVLPMTNALNDISLFLNEMVHKRKKLTISIITDDITQSDSLKNTSGNKYKNINKSYYRKKLSSYNK